MWAAGRSHACLQYIFPVPYGLRVRKIIRQDRWRAIDIIKPRSRNSEIVPLVHYANWTNGKLAVIRILFEYIEGYTLSSQFPCRGKMQIHGSHGRWRGNKWINSPTIFYCAPWIKKTWLFKKLLGLFFCLQVYAFLELRNETTLARNLLYLSIHCNTKYPSLNIFQKWNNIRVRGLVASLCWFLRRLPNWYIRIRPFLWENWENKFSRKDVKFLFIILISYN